MKIYFAGSPGGAGGRANKQNAREREQDLSKWWERRLFSFYLLSEMPGIWWYLNEDLSGRKHYTS